jgi:hypothetical protein
MKFTSVLVRRDETHTAHVMVAPWEVPVLVAKNGEANVTVGETKEYPDRPYPRDAETEYQRLSNLYGKVNEDGKKDRVVEFVYGTGPTGVAALRKAIEDVRKSEKGAKVQSDDEVTKTRVTLRLPERAATADLVG